MTLDQDGPAIAPVAPPTGTATGPDQPRLALRRRLLYSVRIRRVEFLPVTLAIILVPALLAARSWGDLATGRFVAVAVMIAFIINFGDMVNCLADRDVDAVYKTRLSESVYGLGLANVRRQIRFNAVVIVALAGYLAWETGHWDLLPLTLVELYFAAQYSIPPLYLKSKGAWQIPTLIGIILVLPMVIVVRAFPVAFDWPMLLFILGFGVCQIGIVLVNTAEDIPEDEEFDIRTSVIALGLTRAMVVAAAMVGVGGVAEVVAVFLVGDPSWGAVPFIAAVAFAFVHVTGTWLRVRGELVAEALRRLRPRAKLVPLQVATTGWGAAVAAAVVLVNR